MLKKDFIEDDFSQISDSQLEQMEKLKPLIRGVLYKFTEYKDAPDSMNFFRADVYRYFFLLSFMCEYFENNEIIKFDQLSIDLKKLKTTVITKPKLQETSTINLLSCFSKKKGNLDICNEETKKEIIPLVIRRILLPAYIPLLALICSFLLVKQKNYFLTRTIVFISSSDLLSLKIKLDK